MASYSDIFMGRVFLRSGWASFAQVAACLQETAPDRDLATVLVARRFLPADQAPRLRQVVAHMQFLRGELVFAKILMEHKLVTQANVDRAFQIQKQMQCRQRIGEILVLWQKLTPAQVEAVCDEQLLILAEEAATIEAQGLNAAGYGAAHAMDRVARSHAQTQAARPVAAPVEEERPTALVEEPRPSGRLIGKTRRASSADIEALMSGEQAGPAPPTRVPVPPQPEAFRSAEWEEVAEDSQFDPHELQGITAPSASDSIFEGYSPASTLPVDSAAFASSLPSLNMVGKAVPADVPTAPKRGTRVTADRILRAFESAILMAGMEGMLARYNPKPGQSRSKPIQVIYDAATKLFKAPLVPEIQAEDTFQLLDGSVFKVKSVEIHEVDGTPCYQQFKGSSVGLVDGPLRDSWDGMIPGADF